MTLSIIGCKPIQPITAPQSQTEDPKIVGVYDATLVGGATLGTNLVLTVYADNTIMLASDYLNGEPPVVEIGTWRDNGDGTATIEITGRPDFAYSQPAIVQVDISGDQLVATEYRAGEYVVPGSLAWGDLQDATYPAPWLDDGEVILEDGVYSSDDAAAVVAMLSQLRAYGDLNGDGLDDAVVVLVNNPAQLEEAFQIVVVVNRAGEADPIASTTLGTEIFVRNLEIENGQIVADVDQLNPTSGDVLPGESKRYVFRLEGDEVVTVEESAIPAPEVKAHYDAPATTIEMLPGATTALVRGDIAFNGIDSYLIDVDAGQTMTVTIDSPYSDVWLSIYGADGVILTSVLSQTTAWAGEIPSSQEYTVSAVAVGSDTPYQLIVELRDPPYSVHPMLLAATADFGFNLGQGQQTQEQEKVIHLSFDDGPAPPPTDQMLALFEQHNVKADFFVLGQQVQRFPDHVNRQYDAGHALGNHTFSHISLSGASQEQFFQEVNATRDLLGERGSPCLRPPYGATDGFTRARAAELGYEVIMWDIDTRDWSRPGVDAITNAVLEKAFSGAVVLMHDGGGDRTQTVAALEQLLPALANQGYRFTSLCRQPIE